MGWLFRLFGHAAKEPRTGGSSGRAGAAGPAAKAADKSSSRAPSPPALRHASAHLDPPGASDDEDADFDPYNTGVFDRSAPWDRLRKRK